mgnify:FL=1
MKRTIIRLQETDSTNRYLRDMQDKSLTDITVVVADYQTAGRGQGTNRWESEAGKNLLFSLRIHPTMLPVSEQFLLSMSGGLALHETLQTYADGFTLKWPNDIYWYDYKVSGTLIETMIACGRLQSCIFGVGINVNQRMFCSDAPNPMSLCTIVGCEIDRERLLKQVLAAFEKYYDMLCRGDSHAVVSLYHEALYRRGGFYKYRDTEGSFKAEIVEVKSDGHLVLRDRQGMIRSYAFKEVEFMLN